MQDWRWVSAGVALLTLCWLGASARTPAILIVADGAGAKLAPLEARVGSHPGDARALARLADAYLERSAPGLAKAALDRAPPRLRDLPHVTDARARALSSLGNPRLALELERSVLARCSETPCSPTLVGHAAQRAEWLEELVRMGVRDPVRQPRLAMLAYRRSVREVALDVR